MYIYIILHIAMQHTPSRKTHTYTHTYIYTRDIHTHILQTHLIYTRTHPSTEKRIGTNLIA